MHMVDWPLVWESFRVSSKEDFQIGRFFFFFFFGVHHNALNEPQRLDAMRHCLTCCCVAPPLQVINTFKVHSLLVLKALGLYPN